MRLKSQDAFSPHSASADLGGGGWVARKEEEREGERETK